MPGAGFGSQWIALYIIIRDVDSGWAFYGTALEKGLEGDRACFFRYQSLIFIQDIIFQLGPSRHGLSSLGVSHLWVLNSGTVESEEVGPVLQRLLAAWLAAASQRRGAYEITGIR